MYEVFLSGLKEWKEKLKKEVEELEEERETRKTGSVFYDSLTGRIEMRCDTLAELEHQIELKEKRLDIIQGAKK